MVIGEGVGIYPTGSFWQVIYGGSILLKCPMKKSTTSNQKYTNQRNKERSMQDKVDPDN